MQDGESPEDAAVRIAAEEGLQLVRALNRTGFLGVAEASKGGRFRVRAKESSGGAKESSGGARQLKDVDLGIFDSAAEGALAYARFLGPEGCAHAASRAGRAPKMRRGDYTSFGVSPGALPPPLPLLGMSTQHVLCKAVSDSEDYGDSEDESADEMDAGGDSDSDFE